MQEKTILLVEDDPLISDLYGSVLELGGYVADKLTDGTKVLEHVKESPPALIVLDLMMPKMSGMEVLDLLKADKEACAIPVIMFSNLLDNKAAQQAVEKGAVKYALKSDYPPRAFIILLHEVLGGGEA